MPSTDEAPLMSMSTLTPAREVRRAMSNVTLDEMLYLVQARIDHAANQGQVSTDIYGLFGDPRVGPEKIELIEEVTRALKVAGYGSEFYQGGHAGRPSFLVRW
ncbi:hypothetical protein KIKIMORA_04260 [Brevundimonas phage vB_BpoS-Kikimora]|uniref:Uncharacterized protein n=1 Tax=Brevundimonas phage vB_BpoS-Kikimora TaxID=2948601 RepID=A0A9E7MT20_9CAUD|nr:hypothetical protein KIKIMORA_04260 [Brevundimonas phage vB_BpoS-Kikimora]